MDARSYLQRQGWQGDGHSLGVSGNGIKKPLLISYRDHSLGIGGRKQKEKQADQWWLKAFDSALKDFGTGKESTLASVTKLGVGRGGLYGFFVKGQGLEGTISDESSIIESVPSVSAQSSPVAAAMSVPVAAEAPAVEVKKSKKRKQADSEIANDEVVKVKKSKKDKKEKKEKAVSEPEYVNGSRAGSLLVEDAPMEDAEPVKQSKKDKKDKKDKKRKEEDESSFVIDTVGTPVEELKAEKKAKKSKKSKTSEEGVAAPATNGTAEPSILDSLLDKLPTNGNDPIPTPAADEEPAAETPAAESRQVMLLDLSQIKNLQRAVKTLKKHIKQHKNSLFRRSKNGDKNATVDKEFMKATKQHLKRTRAAILRQLEPKAKLDKKIALQTAGVIVQFRNHIHKLLEEENDELEKEGASNDIRKDLEALKKIMVAKVYAETKATKKERKELRKKEREAEAAAKAERMANGEASSSEDSDDAKAEPAEKDGDFITLAVADEPVAEAEPAQEDTNGMHPARLAMLNDPTPLPEPSAGPGGPRSFSTLGAGGFGGKRYKGKKGGGNGAGPGGRKAGGKKDGARAGLPKKNAGKKYAAKGKQ